MKCGTVTCEAEGTRAFQWPGSAAQAACSGCWLRAYNIARNMGFELTSASLEQVERRVALDSLQRLGGTDGEGKGQL